MAGGITPNADIRKIQVRRLTRTGTEQQINVDLWKLLQEGDLSQDAMLQQGDTIIVPTATTAETQQNAEIAAASFSPDTVKISLVGEVVSPGAKSLAPNTSLNQALVEAGGFNESRANKKQVELIRIHPNGTVSRRQIPINLSGEVNEETNPTLRNNDVIVVGRSGGATFRDGLGTVLNSLSPINNFLGLFRFVNIFN
jgi:polysaccharide export outer membrane protein